MVPVEVWEVTKVPDEEFRAKLAVLAGELDEVTKGLLRECGLGGLLDVPAGEHEEPEDTRAWLQEHEPWLQEHGLGDLIDASMREQEEERDEKCLEVFAGKHSRFQVSYEAGPDAGGHGVVRLGLWVAADQVKEGLKPILVPTPLDVTAGFVNVLLNPKKFLPKVMGFIAQRLVMQWGIPPLLARLIGHWVERLFGSLWEEPAGKRDTAAKMVGRFTVGCDLAGGHVTSMVVDFLLGPLTGGG